MDVLVSLDADERARKKLAREGHRRSDEAQNARGFRAKMLQQERRKEKIQMRKRIKAHEERNVKSQADVDTSDPVPAFLLDRSNPTSAKALSSAIKNRRNEKSARFSVPLPKVRGISEAEMFKVVKTGKKTKQKSWKRVITKPTFVGPDFTRQPVKYERFIRYVAWSWSFSSYSPGPLGPLGVLSSSFPPFLHPLPVSSHRAPLSARSAPHATKGFANGTRPMALRQKKANVTHPELNVTVRVDILSVKKNPQNPLYTRLGVLTRGTIIEVNVSELGITTASGKVVGGRWAQITSTSLMRASVPTFQLLVMPS